MTMPDDPSKRLARAKRSATRSQSAISAGARYVNLIDEPMAAALGAGLSVT